MKDLYRPLEQPQPLRLQVHQTLERMIVNGNLEPGQRLVETELAGHLGVSRGPIREALQMLAREGWVELRPRQGTYVAKPTLDELLQYFEVRVLLETETARLAARAVAEGPSAQQQELLTELKDVVARSAAYADQLQHRGPDLDEQDVEEARRFHRDGSQRFHHGLARMAGNQALLELLDRLSKRTRWYFSPRVLERSVPAWQEHDQLLAAVERGDPDAAAELMTSHMAGTRGAYLKAYTDDGATTADAGPT